MASRMELLPMTLSEAEGQFYCFKLNLCIPITQEV